MLARPAATLLPMATPSIRGPLGPWAALMACLLVAPAAEAQSRSQGVIRRPDQNRPAGMALLLEREIVGGKQALGVFAVTQDPSQPGLRRIKVWEELPNDVTVRSETIQCSPTGAMRVTNDGRNLILRELNPGGAISIANRLDHLIWWAACFPEQAGREPSELRDLARELGYGGNRVEREQVVPAGAQ